MVSAAIAHWKPRTFYTFFVLPFIAHAETFLKCQYCAMLARGKGQVARYYLNISTKVLLYWTCWSDKMEQKVAEVCLLLESECDE